MKKLCLWLTMVLLLTGVAVGFAVPVAADTVYNGEWGDLQWELNTTTGHLTISGSGDMKGFQYYVSSDAWLPYVTSIRMVTIGDGVTSIGDQAFFECRYLTDIDLPDSIVSIGNDAFYYCYSLETIAIPDGVTSIGERAFFSCDGLMEIEFPGSVATIKDYAFFDCNGLTHIEIPSSVTSIGSSSFGSCDRLSGLTVETGNPKYHSSGNCLIETQSKKLVIGCKDSVIPSDGAVATIGRYSFAYCLRLIDMEIPEGVATIEDYAFYQSGVTNLNISESVTSIGSNAFTNCRDIDSLTVKNGNPKYHSEGNCIIETQRKTLVIGGQKSVIPTDGSVNAIGDGAFSGRYDLAAMELPDCITKIGDHAFENCCNLKEMELPDGITSIGNYAFSGCNSLSGFKIPDSVTFIGEHSFAFCHGLTTAVIPKGVTKIGDWAFWGCSGLRSVELPNSVVSIGARAFSDCTSLTGIKISGNVKSIGNFAFAGCSRLSKVIYCGTKTQWNRMEKSANWDDDTGNYTLQYHDWDAGNVTKEPTCAEGVKTFVCSICRESKDESVEAIAAHIYDSETDTICNVCEFVRTIEDESASDSAEDVYLLDLFGCQSSVSGSIGWVTLFALCGTAIFMRQKKAK